MRAQAQNSVLLFIDWLTKRGPGAVFLRITMQITRIILGRPVYRYSRITPQMYIGGQHRKHGWQSMQLEGITAVVNLRQETDDAKYGIVPERYLYLPTRDNNPPTLEDLSSGVDFIREEIEHGGKVYIHCGVGVGRAPTLAAAYLISTGMTPVQAWKHIRDVRPFIWPMKSQYQRVEEYAALLRNHP